MENSLKIKLAQEQGIVWLEGDVNSEMKGHVKSSIGLHISNSKNGKYKDLIFLIDSGGGSLEMGLGIHDIIVAYPGHTTTVVFPFAASSAATILQAGKKRIATPGSKLLFHNPAASNVKFDILDSDEAFAQLKSEILADKERLHATLARLKKNPEELNSLCREDRNMFPEEALRIGAIDEISATPF